MTTEQMTCQRCGKARILRTDEDIYAFASTQIIIAASLYFGFCAACMENAQEILEHWIEGGTARLVDDDNQVWTYRLADGVSVVDVPEVSR